MAKAKLSGMSIGDLQAEIRRRQRGLKGLMKKRDKAAARLAAIEREISSLGGALGSMRAIGGGRKRFRNESNLMDALASSLKGKTLSVTELAAKVQTDGYKTTSPNFRTIVNQALLRDRKRFKRVGHGKYTVQA